MAEPGDLQGYSLLGVVPCALLKSSQNCECSGGPVRRARLAASGVRAVPYPQPTAHHPTGPPAPDSTTQQVEQPSTTTGDVDHCHQYYPQQPKIAAYPCAQNSIAIPFNTGANLPVIQNPCVIPVDQCYPNGVINNSTCLPVGQCYTSVVPAAAATSRYQTSECRCAPDGTDCCHPAIPYTPTTSTTSMLFVPYSLPSFPPQYRGNIAVSTSPCSATTPIKVGGNRLLTS